MYQLDLKKLGDQVSPSYIGGQHDRKSASTEDGEEPDRNFKQPNLPRVDGLHVPIKTNNRCIVCAPKNHCIPV